jgi:hypothetical protein
MKIRIKYRKLGKEKVWGLAHLGENLIEIDERLKGYRLLLYLLHEFMHIRHPEWSETKVRKESSKMAKFIWNQQFRKIEK